MNDTDSSIELTLISIYFSLLIQSTNIGRAYVVSGGIGQRRVSLVIEAQSTLYFSYRASIFGY